MNYEEVKFYFIIYSILTVIIYNKELLEVFEMKLSNKLILSFLFSIFVSIFLISFISNSMINKRFDTYLVEEQQKKLERISKDLNSLYNENGMYYMKGKSTPMQIWKMYI